MQLQIDYGRFTPPPTNLVDRLAYWADAQPDEIAFVFLADGEADEQRITYRELDLQARTIARRLVDQRLQGERALLLYPPGLSFIAALFGCFYAGVTAVPAYPPRRNRNMLRIQAISDDAQASIALTSEEVARAAGSFFEEAPHLERLLWMATDAGQASRALDGNKVAAGDFPTQSSDDLALLQYTSGSTGMPKGVMLSHGNLMHNVALISHAFGPRRSDVGVSWLPTYHDMGLIGGILNPVFFGRPNILMSPMAFLARPARWLQAISRYGAAISGGPNFAYQLCVDRVSQQDCEGLDLSCWKVAYNGAEPIRPETLDSFTQKFAPHGFQATAHYPCYGLAEASLIVTGSDRNHAPIYLGIDSRALAAHRVVAPREDGRQRELVGSGRALPDTEVAIVDPHSLQRLDDGEVGEIWIRSPSVAKGYWNQPEQSRETFGAHLRGQAGDAYLRTGDLGFVDGGELFVTGRLKDLIILRGANRYPQDIEHTVEQCDSPEPIGAAAAFGVEMHNRERLVVVCEMQRRRREDWGDVLQAIRNSVAREHDVPPDAIVLVRFGSLPKTSSGKLQRHACRDAFLEGSLRVVAQWRSWREGVPVGDWANWRDEELLQNDTAVDGDTARVVLEQVRAVARDRANELSLDTNIVELGLDSLERMEIVAALEERFGGRLPSDVVAEAETCREVILAVQTFLGPATGHLPTSQREDSTEWSLESSPQFRQLQAEAALLDSWHIQNPFFQTHDGIAGATTTVGGKELINFASYNYLGMSGDPQVQQAAKDAIEHYGTSVSASRLVSGERPIHQELEKALAELVGAEDAIVFVGGHATNESTIGHLFGPGDLILHDALAHNSIIQGALLSGARRRSFPHNDWAALDRLLGRIRGEYHRVLIAIEGVYGMDGDIPDLPGFVEVKKRHQAILMVDEAHSLGTIGATGRGIGEHFGIDSSDVDLWMGTLSKSLGSCGGYIAGRRAIVEFLRYTAPGFVFSVGISPPNAASALASIRVMLEHPERVARLHELSAFFLRLAKEAKLNTGRSAGSPVIPVILGDARRCMEISQRLLEAGINVRPLLPPAVEENAARLRFFITCDHTEEQLRTAALATKEALAKEDAEASNGQLHAGNGKSHEPVQQRGRSK